MLKFILPLAILPVLALSQPAEARRLFWWQNPDGTVAYDDGYAPDNYDDRYGPDPYASAQDRFNDREYRMYRRDMMRRMRKQAYIDQNQQDDPDFNSNLPYAAPVTPTKPSPVKKSVQAKPATKPVTQSAATDTTQGTATQTASSQPAAPKKSSGAVTCDKGLSIVSSFGFEKVSSKSCDGKTFVYSAERSGKPFEIEVSSTNGELTAVKKL